MATLFPRRPPPDTRVLVVLRAPPAALAARLPAGLVPRTCRGHGLLVVDVALRCGRAVGWPVLPRGEGSVDQLVWRVPVLADGGAGEPHLWLAQRLSARGRVLPWPRLRTGALHPRFRLEEDGPRLHLDVVADGHALLDLVAEPRAGLSGSVFACVREADEEFASFGPLAGSSGHSDTECRLVPPGLALDPLLVHSVDVSTPPELGGPGAVAFEVDSAFRLADRRRRPIEARAAEPARAPAPAQPGLSPALSTSSGERCLT